MDTSLSVRRFTRRAVAVAAAGALALAGAVAVSGPSEAASLLQPASVAVSVDGGSAFAGSTVTASFTVTNRSTKSNLAAFTIVAPPGVSAVQGVGVAGPGNWRETVVSCGLIKSCSSLVLVYGTLPLATSLVKPGGSVTASISFKAPATPQTLSFPVIGIGGGIFTTADTPTIAVVAGTAGSFCVTPNPGNVTAGTTTTFTVHAMPVGATSCTAPIAPFAYAGGDVRVKLTSDDAAATFTSTTAGVTPTSGGQNVVFHLPSSSTGAYTFSAYLQTAAANQSFDATETKAVAPATGNSGGFVVSPGTPTAIFFDSIADESTGPSDPALPNPAVGQPFLASFHLTDAFGNIATSPSVTLSEGVGGPGGVLTTLGYVPPVISPSGSTPGAIRATYDTDTIHLPLVVSLGTLSAPLSTVVDGVAQSVVLAPGQATTLTLDCSLTPSDPVCATVNLPNGANGAVAFVQQTCGSVDPTNGAVCGKPANSDLAAITYVRGDLTGLYTRTTPATLTITCTFALCPHRDESVITYYNAEEYVEDAADYPVFGQDSGVPTSTPFTQLPPCQYNVDGTAFIGETDVWCVDVQHITRSTAGHYVSNPGEDGSTFVPDPGNGDLTIPVLFLNDPKIHI